MSNVLSEAGFGREGKGSSFNSEKVEPMSFIELLFIHLSLFPFLQELVCARGKSCILNEQNRKLCSSCRWDKCIKAGMKVEMVEVDIASNGRRNRLIVSERDNPRDNHSLISSDTQSKEQLDVSSSEPKDITHPFLFLRRHRGPPLDYKIVEMSAIPFVSHRITIEIPIHEEIPDTSWVTTTTSDFEFGFFIQDMPSSLFLENFQGK